MIKSMVLHVYLYNDFSTIKTSLILQWPKVKFFPSFLPSLDKKNAVDYIQPQLYIYNNFTPPLLIMNLYYNT